MRERGEPVDVITVHDQLVRAGTAELAGGMEAIAELLDAIPSAANVEAHARILMESAARRAILAQFNRARRALRDGAAPGETITQVIQELGEVQATSLPQQTKPVFRTLRDLADNPDLLRPPGCVLPKIGWRARTVAVCGPDKSGKSTLLAHAVAALTRRRDWLGQPVGAVHGRAVWAGLEEAIADPVKRFHELGADPDGVQLLELATPDVLQQIKLLLTRWPADLVVVDSLSEYARVTRGEAPDDSDNAGWGAVTRPLVQLSREHDIAVVILHHVRRADGEYRGGTEIAAAVDALLEMFNPLKGEDPNSRFIRGRGRWTIEPFRVELTEGRYELAGGSTLSLDARVLLHVETNPGLSANAIRKAVGARGTAVDAAINQLIQRGVIENRGLNGRFVLYPTAGQPRMEGI